MWKPPPIILSVSVIRRLRTAAGQLTRWAAALSDLAGIPGHHTNVRESIVQAGLPAADRPFRSSCAELISSLGQSVCLWTAKRSGLERETAGGQGSSGHGNVRSDREHNSVQRSFDFSDESEGSVSGRRHDLGVATRFSRSTTLSKLVLPFHRLLPSAEDGSVDKRVSLSRIFC